MSEVDLENMLLEAAGRTGGSRRSKQSHQSSRRRHKGSYSDDESDSQDDDSDDNHGRSDKKSSRSQVPLKKRSKKGDDDQGGQRVEDQKDDRFNREGYSSDESDVGSDLYKDENDREELSKLTELEREMILSDRAAKIDDRKLHKQMKSRLNSEKNSQSAKDISPPSSSRGLRSSTRYIDRSAAKTDALKELKARRMKRDPEGRQRFSGEHSGSPRKRKGITASSSGSSSDSENGSDFHSEEEGSQGGQIDYSDDERDKAIVDLPTYDDVKSITIKRSKLAKWFMEPFFEELIVGCFVRVGIGTKAGQNIYRLCIVQNVDASDPNKRYQLDNRATYKYLNCVWGNDRSAARWQMARVSDAPATLEEFNEWSREVNRSGGLMPRRKDILQKQEAIDKINSFVYSAETVKQMLQEKKSASGRPKNIAAEKEKLRRELDVAEYKEDRAGVEKIKSRLKELEETRKNQELDAKALKLAEMNRKNRADNFRVSSSKAANRCLNPGDAGYDPFSRRWTRSTNYYAPKQVGGDASTGGESQGGGVDVKEYEDSKKGEGKPADNVSGVTAMAAALVAAAEAGKLVDTNAPMGQGTQSGVLHNFELPISLSQLQRFGGAYGAAAGFLARKQRIEATVGCQVAIDDERRHPMALSVGDYKRRRGLL